MILLVDDEEIILTLAKQMLEYLGHKVLTAADGLTAVDLYREHSAEIVLVVLDLTMPRMDGEETYERLRSIEPDVRVIFTSGYPEQEVRTRFNSEGIRAFVQKPYRMDTLREAIVAAST